MKRFSGIAVFVLAAVFAATGTDTAAREKTVGMSLAYNEFSATFTMPVKDRETIMISANLDMSGVIPGDCLFPGVSANVAYLYEFAGITFPSGESMGFLAGPGAGVGYVRDTSGAYGAMVSLTGCIGFEYVFMVPVSISLTLEPCIGLHLSRDRFGYLSMGFYKAGLIYSLLPHLGIKYRF